MSAIQQSCSVFDRVHFTSAEIFDHTTVTVALPSSSPFHRPTLQYYKIAMLGALSPVSFAFSRGSKARSA
jgi:hypothetical protein